MNWKGFRRKWKLSLYGGTTESLRHGSRCPCRDAIRVPLECKSVECQGYTSLRPGQLFDCYGLLQGTGRGGGCSEWQQNIPQA
jgi:hypothetical protein